MMTNPPSKPKPAGRPGSRTTSLQARFGLSLFPHTCCSQGSPSPLPACQTPSPSFFIDRATAPSPTEEAPQLQKASQPSSRGAGTVHHIWRQTHNRPGTAEVADRRGGACIPPELPGQGRAEQSPSGGAGHLGSFPGTPSKTQCGGGEGNRPASPPEPSHAPPEARPASSTARPGPRGSLLPRQASPRPRSSPTHLLDLVQPLLILRQLGSEGAVPEPSLGGPRRRRLPWRRVLVTRRLACHQRLFLRHPAIQLRERERERRADGEARSARAPVAPSYLRSGRLRPAAAAEPGPCSVTVPTAPSPAGALQRQSRGVARPPAHPQFARVGG